jgi:5-methyltetrahydropteroyltriglutamate--homocysteine methyltransferase
VAEPRLPARAEIVGSLLRPPRLLEAAARVYEPGHLVMYDEERERDRTELDRIAEEEIRRVVRRQVDAGLDVVSDGEFRRLHFISSFHNAVHGFRSAPGRRFHNDRGEEVQVAEGHVVAERLRRVDSTIAREAAFLREITGHPFKVTLPAGSWFAAPSAFRPGITDQVYESHEELLADAIDAGARYIQLDFPLYPALVDSGARADLEEQGAGLDRTLQRVSRRRHVRFAHLPRQLPLALGLRGSPRPAGRADLRPSLQRLPDRVGRPAARRRLLGAALPPARAAKRPTAWRGRSCLRAR